MTVLVVSILITCAVQRNLCNFVIIGYCFRNELYHTQDFETEVLRVVGTKITAFETLRRAVSTNLSGGGDGAKIFRKLRQEDEKVLAGNLATRTSTIMQDFVSQETVTCRQKIYFVVQLYINF